MDARKELEKLDRDWVKEKNRYGLIHRWQLEFAAAVIFAPVGFAMIRFGNSLHQDGIEVWRDAPGHWCQFLGACFVIASLVLFLHSYHRLRVYNQAKEDYDVQREKLVHDIYAGGQSVHNGGSSAAAT
jgi:hypothetical protein